MRSSLISSAAETFTKPLINGVRCKFEYELIHGKRKAPRVILLDGNYTRVGHPSSEHLPSAQLPSPPSTGARDHRVIDLSSLALPRVSAIHRRGSELRGGGGSLVPSPSSNGRPLPVPVSNQIRRSALGTSVLVGLSEHLGESGRTEETEEMQDPRTNSSESTAAAEEGEIISHAEAEQGAAHNSVVPTSPVDDLDEEEQEEEQLPKRRRFESSAPSANVSIGTVPITPVAAAASSAGGMTAAASEAVAKVRVFLPTSNKTIDVPLKANISDVLLWQHIQLRSFDGKPVGEDRFAGGWLGNEPVPIGRSIGQITEGLFPPVDAHSLELRAMSLDSAWGSEASWRTFIVLIAVAAQQLESSSQLLTLRLVSSRGISLSVQRPADSRLHERGQESALRKAAADLEKALETLIKEGCPVEEKLLTRPELLGHFERRTAVISAAMAKASTRPALPCHFCRGTALLAQGYFSGLVLPHASELSMAHFQVIPLVAAHGLFILFAPPTSVPRDLPPLNDAEERALLIAISVMDESARQLQVDSVCKLNELVDAGELACKRHIELAEAVFARHISSLADRIVNSNRPRLILVSSPPYGGVEWVAHALDLQLRVRGMRGLTINVNEWSRPNGGGVRLEDLRKDLDTLFTSGQVQIRGPGGHVPKQFELSVGGYVLLYGEDLADVVHGGVSGGGADALAELPQQRYCVQVLPLCCVSIDEFSCIGGSALPVLRCLANTLAAGGGAAGLLVALKAWLRRWPSDRGHLNLTRMLNSEWKMINFSFEYELSLYATLLVPALSTVPASDEAFAEARRLLDMLAPFHQMPVDFLPSTSPTRSFCGGAWISQ